MSKYIVKNCENCYFYEDDGYFCEFQKDNTMFSNPCKDSTCLIKQVIDKCKEECDPTNDDWCRVKEDLSNEISQLFEIEECNNEDL